MIKRILTLAIAIIFPFTVFCGDLSRVHTFVDSEILTASLLNNEFDSILGTINDLDSDNFASDIAITSSGSMAFSGAVALSGATTVSGNLTTTGTNNYIGNGGSDVLVLNTPGGITITPATTWTLTGLQTVSGTWANLGTVTTVDINGGSFDGITSLTAANDLDLGDYALRAKTFTSDVATGTAPFAVTSTTKVTNLNADTVNGATSSNGVNGVFLPSGALFFMLTGSCPTGTTDVTSTYSGRYVKAGASAGTKSAIALTGATAGHSLTGAENGPHTHSYYLADTAQDSNQWAVIRDNDDGHYSAGTTGSSGSGTAHTHDLSGATTLEPLSVQCTWCQVN